MSAGSGNGAGPGRTRNGAAGPGPAAGFGAGVVLRDRYVVERLLATGGTASIFRGLDRVLDRPVALKVLHPHLAGTDSAERFAREGRLVATLAHPNLAPIYDMDEEGGLPYLVMAYVDGEDLASLIRREGPPGLGTAIAWALQIARGLEYTHSREVVHRDVKAQNILVAPTGEVKIVDFGIARGPEAMEVTAPGWVLGTAHYLAPEVAAGRPATERSDLYSLGIVLYLLFTGTLPFDGDDPLAVAMQHRNDPVPPPRALRPDLPEAIEEALLRLLEKDPAKRPASASDLVLALAALAQS